MVEIKYSGDALWERIERAVEKRTAFIFAI
jgi:hypothetical protein